jgi:hypothetical protein
MSPWQAQTEPFFNRAAVAHHKRELPHDDFRRAHYDFRDAHFYWRRPNYDFRMTFISRVLAPSAFRKNTSGSSEEGDNAG